MYEAICGLLGKVFDALKTAAAFLFIRRATKIESERDALKDIVAIQKEQLDISTRPVDSPVAVRNSMRDGKL